MVLPFVICAASPNGSVLAIRADGRGNSEILAKHFEPKGVQLPMTIMVLDQQNSAVRVTIDPTGQTSSDFPSADPKATRRPLPCAGLFQTWPNKVLQFACGGKFRYLLSSPFIDFA